MAAGTTRRVAATLTALVLALVSLVLLPAPAALADFASQCAAPDRTVSASDPSISVAAGETVLVASDFSGGVDALPAGGTLCVAPGATLSVSYMNNAAGALVVAAGGSLLMPSVVVATGFSLELEGTATFVGLGINGAADVHVAPDAELTISSGFSPGGGTIVNEGTMTIAGEMSLNSSVSLTTSGTLAVQGGGIVSGAFANDGLATFTSGLTVNASGSMQNTCAITTDGALFNNASGSTNAGVMLVGGTFTNNGSWEQTSLGFMNATGLTDDGAVNGYGRYRFTGPTSVQGSFVGDSDAEPIRVQTEAPAGQVFDVETGTIDNVLRVTLAVPSLPACASAPEPVSADVETTKTGPATVLEGGTVTYMVTVRNVGPQDAADVAVSDVLPAGFELDPASTTGVLVGGVLTWDLGTLPAGAEVTLSFSGDVTAPAGSTLLNVVSSTSSTADPDPTNNDGTADSAQVSTDVLALPPPPNNPPVADDLVRDTTTGMLVIDRVTASDPDADQELAFTLVTAPANGRLYLSPSGGFVYVSDRDFAGVDTFDFEVCDNASPTPACDTGTVTIDVFPRAVDDTATTFAGTPVVVPVTSNDTAGAPLATALVTPPSNGTVTVDPGTGEVTYTPDAGFVGTDSFQYEICSPTEPTFCDTATVVVDVIPLNQPPTVAPLALVTTATNPVSGTLVVADPDPGDTLTTTGGIPPAPARRPRRRAARPPTGRSASSPGATCTA